jgi:hypothetical protein
MARTSRRSVSYCFAQRSVARNEVAERPPVDQLHDDERLVGFVLDLVDRADTRMVERRRCSRLVQDLRAT